MRMLAVNIDQKLGYLAQLLHRCRGTVDVGTRTATGIDHPTQEQFVIALEIGSTQRRTTAIYRMEGVEEALSWLEGAA